MNIELKSKIKEKLFEICYVGFCGLVLLGGFKSVIHTAHKDMRIRAKERELEMSAFLNDKTAIASYGGVTNKTDEGIEGYLAFDKSKDGKIDTIKVYSIIDYLGRYGGPCRIITTNQYYRRNPEFKRLKQEYFNKNP